MNQHQKPRILTIDDNPAIHKDFQKILVNDDDRKELDDIAASFFGEKSPITSNHGIDAQLDSALQGKEGYEMVKRAVEEGKPYTLAFCDMRMPPGWDGLTTIEHLWEADPNLQVVICSAYSDNTWFDISERLGQSDQLLILKKPFDNAEVLQIAAALTEKRRLIDAANVKREELEQLIDDRTRMLEEAREDSERLINSIDSALIQIDKSNRVKRWNQHTAKLFGISQTNAVGKLITELPIPWGNDSQTRDLVTQSAMVCSRRTNEKLDLGDQGSRSVNFSIFPIRVQNIYQGKLILANDVTDQRMLEQHLNQAQRLESVGRLAAGVAHEINTPMQFISDHLQFVSTKFDKLTKYIETSEKFFKEASKDELETELAASVCQLMSDLNLDELKSQIPVVLQDSVNGVAHVAKIVKALKELSHPGDDQMVSVDINQTIQSTAAVSTNEWKYVADIDFDLANDLPPVSGYPNELNQVFLNLIVNSAQAMKERQSEGRNPKGKIQIRTYLEKDSVVVELEDEGGGIPDEIKARVLDPFFSTKEISAGIGQGLSISHSVIVQKHNGSIAIDVEEGVGTTFQISLPCQLTTTDAETTTMAGTN